MVGGGCDGGVLGGSTEIGAKRMDSREFGIEGSTEIGFLWVRRVVLHLDIHRGDCRGGDGD